jgi:hypothetical protein
MRVLWTLVKVIVGLAIAIPLGLLAVGLTVGLFGAVFGLAIVALKLACVALLAYGAFSLARRVVFGSRVRTSAPPPRELPPADRYYEAAMRELDAELGTRVR